MTTTINIHPASHGVRVTTIDKASGASDGEQDRRSVEILEPGSAARTFHAHQTRSILVEEVTPADDAKETETRAPIGTGERVEQDLRDYAKGKPTR